MMYYTQKYRLKLSVLNNIISIRNDVVIDETKARVNIDGVFKIIKENLYPKNCCRMTQIIRNVNKRR